MTPKEMRLAGATLATRPSKGRQDAIFTEMQLWLVAQRPMDGADISGCISIEDFLCRLFGSMEHSWEFLEAVQECMADAKSRRL